MNRSDSERYVPPPPPYEFPIQHDQKVADEQVLELSKGGPFPEDEKDSKHPRSPTPPSIPKHTVKSVSGKSQRPLPPRPAGTRSFGSRSKSGSIADIKSYAAQNDYSTEPHVPSFSAIGPSYTQSMFHSDTSALPSPLHHPSSQSSYETSRQTYDDRRPVSPYSLMEPYAVSSFRRPSHMSSQSPLYLLPQNDNFGTRLVFDPSVAYSDSQANTRIAQRGVSASSFYSSSVSSHLHPDSAMVSGSRQRFVSPRSALRSTDRLDETDVRSVRTQPFVSTCPSTPTSLYSSQRTSRWGEYEQRWATSESDFTRDIYPD